MRSSGSSTCRSHAELGHLCNLKKKEKIKGHWREGYAREKIQLGVVAGVLWQETGETSREVREEVMAEV